MKQPTVTSFFLGSNSESGFYSLYDHFCNAPSDMLHIIKGGPGTGKSTFMRRIGNAAIERGYNVEYILCSGDPDSLDGVYIPALHTGWVDGTAPHIIEPRLFGAAGDYVNLGQFCNTALLKECRDLIESITAQYKSHYAGAYAYLHAAGAVLRNTAHSLTSDTEQKLRKRARSKINRELDKYNTNGKPVKRFLRANSCQGNYFLADTVNTLCQRLCVPESHFGLEQVFFRELLSGVMEHGAECFVCPSPLCPDMIEGIILPIEKIGFLSADTVSHFNGIVRTIHLDGYLPEKNRKEYKAQSHLYASLIQAALTELRRAKALHDELEACYRPALDTDALNGYTESVVQSIIP